MDSFNSTLEGKKKKKKKNRIIHLDILTHLTQSNTFVCLQKGNGREMLPIYPTKCQQRRRARSRQEKTIAIYSPKEEHLKRLISLTLAILPNIYTWILEDKKKTNQTGTQHLKLLHQPVL